MMDVAGWGGRSFLVALGAMFDQKILGCVSKPGLRKLAFARLVAAASMVMFVTAFAAIFGIPPYSDRALAAALLLAAGILFVFYTAARFLLSSLVGKQPLVIVDRFSFVYFNRLTFSVQLSRIEKAAFKDNLEIHLKGGEIKQMPWPYLINGDPQALVRTINAFLQGRSPPTN